MLEYKSFAFEAKADSEKRSFRGYASVFDVVDSHGDSIPRGAFAKSIKEKFSDLPDGKSKIKALWLHGQPIGLPTHMEEDSRGLLVEAKVAKTQTGDEALELIGSGVVDEMSIGYRPLKVTYIDEDATDDVPDGLKRILEEIDLFEFSPVVWGSNSETSVEAVKRMSDLAARIEHGGLSPADVKGLLDACDTIKNLLTKHEISEPDPGDDTAARQSDVVNTLRDFLVEAKAFTADLRGNS